jgi:hypothetical protein
MVEKAYESKNQSILLQQKQPFHQNILSWQIYIHIYHSKTQIMFYYPSPAD